MAGYVTEVNGFTKGSELIADVVTKMISNGFQVKFLTGGELSFNKADVGDIYRVILEAQGEVDPLNATSVAAKQPWRVCFDVQGADLVFAHIGTPIQLPDTGVIAVVNKLVSYTVKQQQGNDTVWVMNPYDVVGAIGEQLSTGTIPDVDNTSSGSGKAGVLLPAKISATGIYTAPNWQAATGNVGDTPPASAYQDEVNKGLINRPRRIKGNGAAAPLSYRLVLTPRGMWLGVWEEATTAETASFFNWFLVQRPVDRTTGQVLTSGKAPVFCVNSVGNQFWQFTVREQDIFRPGARRPADVDQEDSECIINTMNQVSLSEDGKYIVTFPSRLNTSRYRYPHELDMIGITSADVVSQYTDVPLRVYGETEDRIYKALHANGSSNTGMRILVLQKGGGVS